MPQYKYTAIDGKGKEVSGVLESENTVVAINTLREKGWFPTNVFEVSNTAAAGIRKRRFFSWNFSLLTHEKIRAKAFVAFVRQLGTLLNSGLPILKCLNLLETQYKAGILKKVLHRVVESVEAGSTFSDALLPFPKIFSPLFVNMIKAGEVGGVMDQILLRLADYYEKSYNLRSRIRSALIYPAFVLTLASLLFVFLVTIIIPRFAQLFREMDLPLPAITRMMIGMSDFLRGAWHFIVLCIIAAFFIIQALLKNKKIRYLLDSFSLHLPIIGVIQHKVVIARLTRTLGTLLSSGVPILQALLIVRETASNMVFSRALSLVHDSVKEGQSLVEPLQKGGVFPPLVLGMVRVGEESGSLAEMLIKIANQHDDEVQNMIAGLTSLLEPILIVFLALIVGFVVLAIFMPLISIITSLTGLSGNM